MVEEEFRHILTPGGWAFWRFLAPASPADTELSKAGRAPPIDEVPPSWTCILLWPSVSLPMYRAMDVGLHAKTLSTSITSVCLTYGTEPSGGTWFTLRLQTRTYHLAILPDSVAASPLSQFSHRLYVICETETCDLSPLIALSNPLDFPELASRVVRTYFIGSEPDGRWIPGCDFVQCDDIITRSKFEQTYARGALDILADPERLNVLFRLIYDQSQKTREEGFKRGLWTVKPGTPPGDMWPAIEDAVKRRDLNQLKDLIGLAEQEQPAKRGQFTTTASVALLYVAHLIPFERIKELLRPPPK